MELNFQHGHFLKSTKNKFLILYTLKSKAKTKVCHHHIYCNIFIPPSLSSCNTPLTIRVLLSVSETITNASPTKSKKRQDK
jgi:hypothetical protein